MAAVIKTSSLIGLLTGAVALGVAELAAAVTGPRGAPVVAVGETAINLTPVPVKEFAIAHFGSHDKAALITGILVLLAAFAALIGVLAVRRLACGLAALAAIMDGRNALLAVGMNGQPLPVAHGFPARMVVPGLYGYVSATKWVTRLTLTTFARQRAYWTQRGYAAQAPVKTESRIDVPRPLAQVKAGQVTVAGMAWAPARGIAAVEVSADNGPWRPARWPPPAASTPGGSGCRPGTPPPDCTSCGSRATDASGATQPPRRAQPFPGGASGWDSVVVTVM